MAKQKLNYNQINDKFMELWRQIEKIQGFSQITTEAKEVLLSEALVNSLIEKIN
jgi:hypothetical protein